MATLALGAGLAAMQAQGGDPTYGANKPFSAFKEVVIRWSDSLYKTTKTWAMFMGRYLYVLSIPNLIVFLIMLAIAAPILGGIYATYQPLLYLRENQVQIMSQLSDTSNTLDVAVGASRGAANHVLRILRPGFFIWNLGVDGIFFLSIKVYSFFGCVQGERCLPFEAMFRWVGQMIPWVTSLWARVWEIMANSFISLTTVGYASVAPDTDISLLATLAANATSAGHLLNGSVLLAAGINYADSTLPLDHALPSDYTHRLFVTRRTSPVWQASIDRERNAYKGTAGGGAAAAYRQQREAYPSDPPAGCVLCTPIEKIVDAVFKPDVFELAIEIAQWLVDWGLDNVLKALDFFVDVILPFFEWLLAFAGGSLATLIAFFNDLFSKVNALFTWVGTVWTSFISVWNSALATIQQTFKKLIEDLNGMFGDVWDFVTDTFDMMRDAIAGALIELVNSIQASVNAVTQQMRGVLLQICSACNSIPCCSVSFTLPGGGSCSGSKSCTSSAVGILPDRRGVHPFDTAHLTSGSAVATSEEQQSSQTSNNTAMPVYTGVSPRGALRHNTRSLSDQSTELQPMRVESTLSVLRDLGYGNLTLDRNSLCASVIGQGFDVYEFYHLSMSEKIPIVLCLGWIEYTEYYDELMQRYRASIGNRKRQIDPSTAAGALLTSLRQRTQHLVEIGQQAQAKLEECAALTRDMAISTNTNASSSSSSVSQATRAIEQIMQLGEQYRKRNLEAAAAAAPPPDTSFIGRAQSVLNMLRPMASRSDADSSSAAKHEKRTARLQGAWERFRTTDSYRAIGDSLEELSHYNWQLDYIRVRHPRVDTPGTAEWHAYQVASEGNAEWEKLGMHLSRQPTLQELRDYLQTNGTRLVEMLREWKQSRNAARSLNTRNIGKDFWDFVTDGFWDWLGERVLDGVEYVTECNPAPAPWGPGGDPNPDVNRFCPPYINPDTEVPDLGAISLSFLIPSCCEPPFRCPAEFDNVYGEVRYLIRYAAYAVPIKWDRYIGWMPGLGPLLVGQLTFPHGKPPSYGWYCFSISTASIVHATFWSLLALIFIAAWIIPLTLCMWCCTSMCCSTSFTLLRCMCMPCGACRPKYAREPQYRKDINTVRAAIGSVPGFGGCTPKYLRGSMMAGGMPTSLATLLPKVAEMIDNDMMPVVAGPGFLFGGSGAAAPGAEVTTQSPPSHPLPSQNSRPWSDVETGRTDAATSSSSSQPLAPPRRQQRKPSPSTTPTPSSTVQPEQRQPTAVTHLLLSASESSEDTTAAAAPLPQQPSNTSAFTGSLPFLPDVEAAAYIHSQQQQSTPQKKSN